MNALQLICLINVYSIFVQYARIVSRLKLLSFYCELMHFVVASFNFSVGYKSLIDKSISYTQTKLASTNSKNY